MDWIKVKTVHILDEYTDLSDAEFRAWIKIMALAARLEHEPNNEQISEKRINHRTRESLENKLRTHRTSLENILRKVREDIEKVLKEREYSKNKKKEYRGVKTVVQPSVHIPVHVDVQQQRREEKRREEKSKDKSSAREETPVDNSRSKAPVEDKPKPKNTHGERWTEEQGETLDELLGDIRNRYGARYHQQVYVFIQSNFNKKNPDAVLHALKRLISDRLAGKAIPLPGKWLESVLNGNGKHPGENGKFEAQESEREHEALKRDESRDVAKMIASIGRAP